jgi:hypothetical protein
MVRQLAVSEEPRQHGEHMLREHRVHKRLLPLSQRFFSYV